MPGQARRPAVAALGAACAAAVLCAACGSAASQPTPTGAPTPTPSPTPPPTAAPDVHALAVAAAGLGVYQETTVPVALVHNRSTQDSVSGATAHFDVLSPGGRVLLSADVPIPPLAPDAEGAVAARLALSGYSNTVRVRLAGGTWSLGGQTASTLDATVSCEGRPCPAGPQSATATVTGTPPIQGAFAAAALCVDRTGKVTGGGEETGTGSAARVTVPLILSSPAVSCRVTFSAAF